MAYSIDPHDLADWYEILNPSTNHQYLGGQNVHEEDRTPFGYSVETL